MNLNSAKYSSYALVKEMLETSEVVKKILPQKLDPYLEQLKSDKIILTGEGSSRIFPAKNLISTAMRGGYGQNIFTENATEVLEYNTVECSIFVASNSGRTKEGVHLIRQLNQEHKAQIFGVVAHDNTPILTESDHGFLLSCGVENAVAATKSVVEQALFYDLFFRKLNHRHLPNLEKLGDLIQQVLELKIPDEVLEPFITADMIYFSGRNNGVAEELTLKTNEITRKKSDFLEGTYAAHGIEEVMQANESMMVINPFPSEEEKFQDVLVKGVKMHVAAIATRQTSFPTLIIPEYGDFTNYLELVAGWNLLVEIGLSLKIDLDKPTRARKIGNEI
jgi:glucosamine--fructose-6-phosphate aminotransferase (isomerizing)